MATSLERKLNRLKSKGLFTSKDAEAMGIPHVSLIRLIHAEKILRAGRGLFYHPNSKIKPEELDFVVACKKFGPESAIGGLTALFYYGLSNQPPHKIWVLVPPQMKTSQRQYRCLRTQAPLTLGVEIQDGFKITNLERTLIEALKYSSKIGLRTALHAIRTAIADKRTTENKIVKMAKDLGLENYIVKYGEAFALS